MTMLFAPLIGAATLWTTVIPDAPSRLVRSSFNPMLVDYQANGIALGIGDSATSRTIRINAMNGDVLESFIGAKRFADRSRVFTFSSNLVCFTACTPGRSIALLLDPWGSLAWINTVPTSFEHLFQDGGNHLRILGISTNYRGSRVQRRENGAPLPVPGGCSAVLLVATVGQWVRCERGTQVELGFFTPFGREVWRVPVINGNSLATIEFNSATQWVIYASDARTLTLRDVQGALVREWVLDPDQQLEDFELSGDGKLYATVRTGETQWQLIKLDVASGFESWRRTVSNPHLRLDGLSRPYIVGFQTQQSATIFAHDAEDGALRWSAPDLFVRGSESFSSSVLLRFSSNRIEAVDIGQGVVQWSRPHFDATIGYGNIRILAEPRQSWAVGSDPNAGDLRLAIYRFGSDGQLLESHVEPTPPAQSQTASYSIESFQSCDGRLIVTGVGRNKRLVIRAFNENHSALWEYRSQQLFQSGANYTNNGALLFVPERDATRIFRCRDGLLLRQPASSMPLGSENAVELGKIVSAATGALVGDLPRGIDFLSVDQDQGIVVVGLGSGYVSFDSSGHRLAEFPRLGFGVATIGGLFAQRSGERDVVYDSKTGQQLFDLDPMDRLSQMRTVDGRLLQASDRFLMGAGRVIAVSELELGTGELRHRILGGVSEFLTRVETRFTEDRRLDSEEAGVGPFRQLRSWPMPAAVTESSISVSQRAAVDVLDKQTFDATLRFANDDATDHSVPVSWLTTESLTLIDCVPMSACGGQRGMPARLNLAAQSSATVRVRVQSAGFQPGFAVLGPGFLAVLSTPPGHYERDINNNYVVVSHRQF